MELLAAKHDFNGNYCSLFFVQDLAYCSLFFVQDLRMFPLQGVCITNGEKQKARAKGVNLRTLRVHSRIPSVLREGWALLS